MPVRLVKAIATPYLLFQRQDPDSRCAGVMRMVTQACRTGFHPGQQRCVTPQTDFRTVLAAPETDRLAKFATLVDLELNYNFDACCTYSL